jgi:hypothetical protein
MEVIEMAELYDAADEIPKWNEPFSSSTPEPVLILDSSFEDTVIEISNDLFSAKDPGYGVSVVNVHVRDENGGDVMAGLTIEAAQELIDAVKAVIDYHRKYTDD